MLSKKIIKYIQSLTHKKLRDEEKAFVAEGPKVVAEFLKSEKFTCKILCALKEWLSENQHLLKGISSDNIFEINEDVLEKISFLKTPNKVLTVLNRQLAEGVPVINNKLSLMLDDIQDPGNLGTIIRIADWFGIENIICSENCVDCYNPKVIQSAMGSFVRVKIWYTSLMSFIEKNKNISVYAAALHGKSVYNFSEIQEGIILIGNESKGISEELINNVHQKITIPRLGNAESLNAAIATGIILSHIISKE